MDPTPLLRGPAETCGMDLLQQLPRRAWNWIQVNLIFWWSVTTNPDYLASWASRRNLQSVLLTLDTIQNLMLRSEQNQGLNLPLKVCYCFLVHKLPRNLVWRDFVVVLMFFGCIMTDALQDRNYDPSGTYMLYDMWGPCLRATLLLTCLGLHSSAVCVFNSCTTIALVCLGPGIGKKAVTQALLNLPLVFVVEFYVASLFNDLQDKTTTLEVLLDKATDGFCSIETSTGIIQNASPQLEVTLGASTKIVGRHIYEFVHINDHSSIEELLVGPSEVHMLNSQLVTCLQDPSGFSNHEKVTFDAKMIPFTVSSHELQICLQVQGELRVDKGELSDDNCFPGISLSLLQNESSTSFARYCAEEGTSEISFDYTMTESLASSTQKSSRAHRTLLSPTTSGIQATMKAAGVQTDEPEPESSDQIFAVARLHTMGSKEPIDSPALPGNAMKLGTLIQSTSCESRGRSPLKRERPPPDSRLNMNLAHARPPLQPRILKCQDEHADAPHQLTAPRQVISVGTERKASPGRRKRIGQDIKNLDDTPIVKA